MMTEKEEKSDRGRSLMVKPPPPPAETAEFLQWGSRKRLRCMRIRGGGGGVGGTTTTTTATATSISPTHRLSSSPSPDPIPPSSNSSGRIRRKTTTRFPSITSAPRLTRNSEAAVTMRSEKRRISPEKEERSYTTRGSGSAVAAAVANTEENGGVDEQLNHHHHLHQIISNGKNGGNNPVWPKLYIALSSKEKEEDFLAMKGCKLPQRPKKRAKLIQRTILLVSPGAWLPEMSLERYEVREKKTSKKQRPRGLKAMGNMDSDSE